MRLRVRAIQWRGHDSVTWQIATTRRVLPTGWGSVLRRQIVKKNKKNAHALACVSQLCSAPLLFRLSVLIYICLCPSQVHFLVSSCKPMSCRVTRQSPHLRLVEYSLPLPPETFHTMEGLNPSKSERRYFYSETKHDSTVPTTEPLLQKWLPSLEYGRAEERQD